MTSHGFSVSYSKPQIKIWTSLYKEEILSIGFPTVSMPTIICKRLISWGTWRKKKKQWLNQRAKGLGGIFLPQRVAGQAQCKLCSRKHLDIAQVPVCDWRSHEDSKQCVVFFFLFYFVLSSSPPPSKTQKEIASTGPLAQLSPSDHSSCCS